ncbi:hypothetical protein SBI_03757 [Streptomyces bingchenggensis BCW-1]|uniref:Uncharacterized protein n=1 Tax=Streptomyces bingchenggensis (strain BCW-1) TaxID=749414 RepID=D7CFX0_STRBB|nr:MULTISPECIES: hypothetical protein [Streptomyces]ADI06878.1 hypothetical protein SBI_03757 [Streptomyces bingchenggensis BCW-1]
MTDRSLAALGFADVPALRPLTYPGRPVTAPALLAGSELWELTPSPGGPGGWPVLGAARIGQRPPREPLDAVLARLGQVPLEQRHPVIAVGSNASPAQLHHKLTALGHPAAVPMVPVRVRGIGVGCSAHIGRYGYVATAPYADPAAETPLVVSWLDAAQLASVDATEFPNYRRILLPGASFPMVLPSGERLGGAYLYVGARGVLAGPDGAPDRPSGRPRPGGGDQSALLTGLLASSARLRGLLGPDPGAWIRRAAADRALRETAASVFADEGWVLHGYNPLSTLA